MILNFLTSRQSPFFDTDLISLTKYQQPSPHSRTLVRIFVRAAWKRCSSPWRDPSPLWVVVVGNLFKYTRRRKVDGVWRVLVVLSNETNPLFPQRRKKAPGLSCASHWNTSEQEWWKRKKRPEIIFEMPAVRKYSLGSIWVGRNKWPTNMYTTRTHSDRRERSAAVTPPGFASSFCIVLRFSRNRPGAIEWK